MADAEGGEDGSRPEDTPGRGVVVAFGRQLKLLRMRAGMDRQEFGKQVGYAAQTVASFEQGRRTPAPGLIDRADEVLGAGGVLKALKEEVLRAQYPPFFRDAARLETGASGLCVYAAQLVPGLLQTEDYARAVFRIQRPLLNEEVIEQRVAARMARQEILYRQPAPLLSFVIEEAVLHKPIGGMDVLRRQRQHLRRVGRERHVEIQVMPNDCEEHAAAGGPFNLIETAEGRCIAYTEVQDDSRLYTESHKVHELETRYSLLRSQAFTPRESSALIDKLLGEQ